MTDCQASFFNLMTCFLARVPSWFLAGKSLAEFVTSKSLSLPVNVMVDCSPAAFDQTCLRSGVNILESRAGYRVVGIGDQRLGCIFLHSATRIDQKYVYAGERDRANAVINRRLLTPTGLWRQTLCEEHPYYVQLPYQYGTVLDLYERGWWIDLERKARPPWRGATFFDDKRRKVGAELLSLVLKCAKAADIYDALWLGFGCCLGRVRNGGFIPSDNDLDICIDTKLITKEQEDAYFAEIQKPFELNGKRYEHGLCEKRFQPPSRSGDGRALWTSIGHRSIRFEYGVKACHWFMFEHGGILWHSKGGRWISNAKFAQNRFQYKMTDEAICLGMPASIVEEKVEVDFEGVTVKMPMLAGTCCDWWYPGWGEEAGGSSDKKMVMAIGKWSDKKTWRVARY